MPTPVNDSLELLTAALANGYRIEREAGSGGMAVVYLAEDLRHHRKVAVKVLRPELAATLGPDRFLREIEVAAQLQHPNIVPLLDSGNAGGFLYYVMPFVDGPSLRERLANQGKLPIHDAIRFLTEIVDALAEAHRQGIVHRDVKPDNVLLSGRHALVTDFGVAKAIDDAAGHRHLTTVGVALGTPAYMAPEQASADPHIDHRADIYAVGVMAYEMLTGSPPFTRSSSRAVLAAHMADAPESLRAQRPEVPSALEAIVLKCLAKPPEERWQSAEELLAELELFHTPSGGGEARPLVEMGRLLKIARKPSVAVPAALVLVALVAAGIWAANLNADKRWAREKAIPQIERQADAGDWEAAYALAKKVQKLVPNDAALAELWPKFSWLISVPSDPPGARVFRRAYSAGDDQWEELGTTPLKRTRFPFGYSLVRFELPDHPPLSRALGWPTEGIQGLMQLRPFKLDTDKSLPAGMVRVPGQPESLPTSIDIPAQFADFFLGRYEVTNREYKKFVDAGGYQRREFWEHPFMQSGKAISWEQAMTLLTDKTGRLGPSTWEAGDYPEGRGDYPVGGVSWYEAAAFARFVGKELPTVPQWRHALGSEDAEWIWPASNLDGDGPAPVGKFRGITWSGAYDMVGNVREWCFNARGDKRASFGGGWTDESAFYNPYNIRAFLPPLDRSAVNGFRLAITHDDSASAAQMRSPRPKSPARDIATEKPASDEAFEIYRRMYTYDPVALNAKIEATDSTRTWIRERVSFDAAYGGERMILYLYLPRNATPPYQSLVYWPGAPAFFLKSIDQYRSIHIDFVLKSGRAVAFPVYKTTFERHNATFSSGASGDREFRIQVTNDLRRTIDYLITRHDINSDKIGYYGYSSGGAVGPISLAIEPRLRVAVLYMAGLWPERNLPEIEPATFLPRVHVPVIMFSGQFDDTFPLETSAKPFFQLLGTPAEHKKHVVAPGSHFVPRAILIREMLNWLDRYLEPVRRQQ